MIAEPDATRQPPDERKPLARVESADPRPPDEGKSLASPAWVLSAAETADPRPPDVRKSLPSSTWVLSQPESVGRRLPDERKPLAPPAWVLPEAEPEEVVVDPLDRLGTSESWAGSSDQAGGDRFVWDEEYEEAGLSGSGAFGGERDDGERRMGLRAFDPGRRGVRALVAVAILMILVAGFLAWRSRPRVDPVAAPSFDAGSVGGAGPASASSASASASAEVVVAVAGKVRKPGLVRLPPGARVADALTAAGGAEPGVDVSMLNLARKVVDGELILVGITPSPGVNGPTAAPVGGGAATTGGLVDLNTATLADLDTLPGVGPVLAQRILDARTARGGFKAVSDLRKVDGIGDARYEQLKDLVTV